MEKAGESPNMKHFVKTLYGKLSLILLTVLLFSVSVIWFHRATVGQYSRQQLIAGAQHETAVLSTAINTSFTILEENLFYLTSSNTYLQEPLRHTSEKTSDSVEYWASISHICRQLETLKSICPYIQNFFVYYPSIDLFLNDRVNPEMTSVVRTLSQSDNRQMAENWNSVLLPSGTCLLRIYPSEQYVLGAWIRMEDLSRLFADAAPQQNDSVNQTFFYSLSGEAFSPDAPFPVLDTSELKGIVEKEKTVIVSSMTEHPGVYLVKFLPEEIHSFGRIGNTSFVIVLILHLILFLFVLVGFFALVLHPMRTLSDGIQRIRNGERDYRIPPAPRFSTEFQEIQQEFNAMMDETQQMHIQMYEQQIQQDEVKLRYLSQQIQPHFILNSLNTLYSYIGRDDDLSKKIIRLLTQYYRYIINIESQYVEIREEMDHLDHYLAFQKVRYADRLQYTIDCDDAVCRVPIPPLLLESFVGNILKHGQDEEDLIQIRISALLFEPDTVRILIADHGSGFPGEILDALKVFQETGIKDDLLGIGICNSIDRLKLIYDTNACISFYNAEEHGAVVEIVIHLPSAVVKQEGVTLHETN